MIAELRNKEWPDACGDGVSCCIGHAVYGPGGCTCWEPVYDQPQAPHNGSFDAHKADRHFAMTALTRREPRAG